MSDYYEVLGIERTATAEQVRKAFRKLALETHPDRIQHPGERALAQEVFVEVNEAYQTLRDEAKRQAYDQQLELKLLVEREGEEEEEIMAGPARTVWTPPWWQDSSDEDEDIRHGRHGTERDDTSTYGSSRFRRRGNGRHTPGQETVSRFSVWTPGGVRDSGGSNFTDTSVYHHVPDWISAPQPLSRDPVKRHLEHESTRQRSLGGKNSRAPTEIHLGPEGGADADAAIGEETPGEQKTEERKAQKPRRVRVKKWWTKVVHLMGSWNCTSLEPQDP